MMKWLTIDYIKQHLRLDYDCEDSLLEVYGDAAEDTILSYINRSYQGLVEEYGGVPAAIIQASLMLVDASYQHRSPVSPQNMYHVLYGFDRLVKPYVQLAGGENISIEVQEVTVGSDVKIVFTASLPDGLMMKDVAFTVSAYNADLREKEVTKDKSECIEVSDNEYAIAVDSDMLGVGWYMLKVVFQIPDSDFEDGFRKEVVRINPYIHAKG